MATKKSGKCYEYVKAALKAQDPNWPWLEEFGISSARGRATEHWIVVDDIVIGRYNHRSGEISIDRTPDPF